MWDPTYPGELHVSIADRADVLAIVPATADLLARLAHGRADDLVTATALCARGDVLVAPAMQPRMWGTSGDAAKHRAARTRALRRAGERPGRVRRRRDGGGWPSRADIVVAILGGHDLNGRRIVVTAGPTHEAIDPVRFIGNRSSGKMGFAIAARAARSRRDRDAHRRSSGAADACGRDADRRRERSNKCASRSRRQLGGADALVMAAAVVDFRPEHARAAKIKKVSGAPEAIALTKNPDLIAEIGGARVGTKPVLVAFALETGDDAAVIAYAKDKLVRKKVDIVVANAAHESLGKEGNRVSFVDAAGASPFIAASKEALAELLLDRVAGLLKQARVPDADAG